jgi:hypothetical protein
VALLALFFAGPVPARVGPILYGGNGDGELSRYT